LLVVYRWNCCFRAAGKMGLAAAIERTGLAQYVPHTCAFWVRIFAVGTQATQGAFEYVRRSCLGKDCRQPSAQLKDFAEVFLSSHPQQSFIFLRV
jgi:hypothetical protein